MIDLGTTVTWDSGTQTGQITDMFNRKITWRLRGSEIHRHETNDKTTYLIRQPDGEYILKHHNEVAIAS